LFLLIDRLGGFLEPLVFEVTTPGFTLKLSITHFIAPVSKSFMTSFFIKPSRVGGQPLGIGQPD
ncbi:hypothetical protein A2U01_0102874, partial [Trifolium medium]|nr:hypothetical protein [Trifolium medium]